MSGVWVGIEFAPKDRPVDYDRRVTWRWSLADKLGHYSIPEPNSGYLLWFGKASKKGYGLLWWEGKTHSAHRLAWISKNGPIPDGMWVLHKCDNPGCINSDHLWLGTRADNIADCVAKGRSKAGMAKKKLSVATAIAIARALGGERKVGRDFGVNRTTVNKIRRGEIWSSVTGIGRRLKQEDRT